MAKGICQHFMDARLIENATDVGSSVFKDKGIYVITPKGLHILERFITKNGINGEHLLPVFSSQPICMKLLHLERRTHDDELLINRPVIEVIFRRFVGRQPNYPPSAEIRENGQPIPSEGEFDRTMGIEMQDLSERVRLPKSTQTTLHVAKHCFPSIAALDWLCDFTTICGRDEAAEIAAHFVRLGFIQLAYDRSRKDADETANVAVRGEDAHGNQTEGEFKCHYKCMYAVTDKGRTTARWAGYGHLSDYSQVQSYHSGGLEQEELQYQQARPTSAAGSQRSNQNDTGSGIGIPVGINGDRSGPHAGNSSPSSDSQRALNRKPSAAERLRNEYVGRGGRPPSSGGAQSSSPGFGNTELPAQLGGYNARDSNTNRLKQILEEPALRSLFREFLKQNFCEENLSFWLDVQDFKRRFHTTSSAVAIRPSEGAKEKEKSGGGSGVANAVKRLGRGVTGSSNNANYGYTAMERHQQDLIAMAFVIYNTYLAPASPCELNIEHNLRADLVNYMNKVISDAKGPGGEGLENVSAQQLRNGGQSGPAGAFSPPGPPGGLEERRAAVHASMPKAPLHASQLQTMVRLYERIQDHIFRLMATDSVPRFIKDPRFLNLVRSVEEYTEALESGRVDPTHDAGPAIGKAVVDAMELGPQDGRAGVPATS
ncbi:REGULATOR OF G PROTEIN SIGNALING [Ceraceosorus bombacis]|uniref:REGULATOR OF G PROTEIN SIGNALING n=1 Tax=Ceraceosorus bombacis TaxID=401625 RepID=A0A0P1BHI2_9BASI|nr:REGULATOR OF G PROTEIN SIGNALING [Ceraceosorus bombacis]